MRIVLFGPPGVGKGTQAQLLCEKYDMMKFSSGDLLREEVALSSPTGRKAEQFIRKGHLVPDDVIYELVDNFLIENADRDILFDGFPRNLNQARSLEKSLAQMDQTIDIALEMHLEGAEIIGRLLGRRYCTKCGRIYNSTTTPPVSDGICDVDHTPLVRREDDTEEIIRHRLGIYDEETRPLIDYYRSLNVYSRIDARGDRQTVFERISQAVNGHFNNRCRCN